MSIKSFIRAFIRERWNIGFVENSLQGIIEGEQISVRWLKHSCKKSWFADPFILNADDSEIVVLCEEFYKPSDRGRISRLCIDRKTMCLQSLDVILELDTHLSYPVLQRKDDKIFIYPESGISGKLTRYLYDDETKSCTIDAVLSKEALADSTILEYGGNEYLFTTPKEDCNGSVLRIYNKDKGCETFSNFVEYSFRENIARMAGLFFFCNGKLYRPAQECNERYGHAVSLQEVSMVDGNWHLNEVRRLYSVNPRLKLGMHTFNVYNDLIVTDAVGYDNYWIRRLLKFFKLLDH